MKNIVYLACLAIVLIFFGGCIADDHDCFFRVTYGLVSPDAQGEAPVDENTYTRGATVVVLGTDAVRPGFDFTGWNTQADGSGQAYQPGEIFAITSNVTLYAQWEAVPVITFDVVYDANGGTGGLTVEGQRSGDVHLVFTPDEAEVVRAGFAFTEWNTVANGSGTAYAPGAMIVVTGDVTLYAQWAGTFTVVYNATEGVGGPFTDIAIDGQPYMFLTSAQSGISRADYALQTWNDVFDGSGTSYAPGSVTTVTEDMTLYAVWTPATTFEITLNPNGAAGDPRVDNISVGTLYTIPSGDEAGFSRPGFTFLDWNTLPDGSGDIYQAGEAVTVTGPVTLYAQWGGVPQFSITYNPNGGEGTPQIITLPQGFSYTIPSAAEVGISRPLFVFASWNTAIDGSGALFAPGMVITVTQNLILSAQWMFAP